MKQRGRYGRSNAARPLYISPKMPGSHPRAIPWQLPGTPEGWGRWCIGHHCKQAVCQRSGVRFVTLTFSFCYFFRVCFCFLLPCPHALCCACGSVSRGRPSAGFIQEHGCAIVVVLLRFSVCICSPFFLSSVVHAAASAETRPPLGSFGNTDVQL